LPAQLTKLSSTKAATDSVHRHSRQKAAVSTCSGLCKYTNRNLNSRRAAATACTAPGERFVVSCV